MESRHSWAFVALGTLLGVLTGSISVYQFVEHRIEERVRTEIKLSELDIAQQNLKSSSWTADENLSKRLDLLNERVAKVEGKMDHPAATPSPSAASSLLGGG